MFDSVGLYIPTCCVSPDKYANLVLTFHTRKMQFYGLFIFETFDNFIQYKHGLSTFRHKNNAITDINTLGRK